MKDKNDELRGTGRTTEQLKNMPENSIFVWCNERTDYAVRLSKFLNRNDIKIIGPSQIKNYMIGRKNIPVIFDHACK